MIPRSPSTLADAMALHGATLAGIRLEIEDATATDTGSDESLALVRAHAYLQEAGAMLEQGRNRLGWVVAPTGVDKIQARGDGPLLGHFEALVTAAHEGFMPLIDGAWILWQQATGTDDEAPDYKWVQARMEAAQVQCLMAYTVLVDAEIASRTHG